MKNGRERTKHHQRSSGKPEAPFANTSALAAAPSAAARTEGAGKVSGLTGAEMGSRGLQLLKDRSLLRSEAQVWAKATQLLPSLLFSSSLCISPSIARKVELSNPIAKTLRFPRSQLPETAPPSPYSPLQRQHGQNCPVGAGFGGSYPDLALLPWVHQTEADLQQHPF